MTHPMQQDVEMRTPEQDDILCRIQMEALGFRRREQILTTEFPEKRTFVPVADIERRINIAGSQENKLAQTAIKTINAWNNAWQDLADDGTAENVLELNEGLGQTHRQRLQEDDSIRRYTGEEFNRGGHFRGGRDGRGGRGGGRGGGFVGKGGGRTVPNEYTAPITRKRLVKGQTADPVEPSKDKVCKAAKKLKVFSETKPVKGVVAKLSGNIDVAASVKRQAVAYGGLLATPAAFMANVSPRPTKPASSTVASKQQDRATTPAAKAISKNQDVNAIKEQVNTPAANTASTKQHVADAAAISTPASKVSFTMPSLTEQRARQTASGKSTSSTSTKSVTTGRQAVTVSKSVSTFAASRTLDLMDLDVGEESSAQPVIEFTHSLGKSVIKDPPEQKNLGTYTLLANFFQGLQDTGRLKPDQIDKLKAVIKTYEDQPSEKLETAQAQLNAKPGPAIVPKGSPKKGKYTQEELTALRPGAATAPKKPFENAPQKQLRPTNPSRSLAKQMEAVRELAIGEHIYQGRWTAPAALVKSMANLSLKDEVPDTKTSAKSGTTAYAKDNSFGPARPTSKFDPGAAGRAYCAGTPAPIIAELTAATLADSNLNLGYTIHGAARSQHVETSISSTTIPFTANNPVVTTRAPYGGASASPENTHSKTTRSQNDLQPPTALRAQQATRTPSGPALPAFLQGLKPADTGAAARVQYGGGDVLAPLSNSSQAPVSNAQAPARQSRINESGFIGMAERARKGQDPVEKSRRLGL